MVGINCSLGYGLLKNLNEIFIWQGLQFISTLSSSFLILFSIKTVFMVNNTLALKSHYDIYVCLFVCLTPGWHPGGFAVVESPGQCVLLKGLKTGSDIVCSHCSPVLFTCKLWAVRPFLIHTRGLLPTCLAVWQHLRVRAGKTRYSARVCLHFRTKQPPVSFSQKLLLLF